MGKLTRRELAAALSTSAVLLAQPAPSSNDELQASESQNRANASQLDQFPLPMTAEPATIFKP
jgi:hypothetical protein